MRLARTLWMWLCLFAACHAPLPAPASRPPSATTGPRWQSFAPEAFQRAQHERRLILLSVQAGFCHWCHVMNATTYRDPQLLALLDARFVAIRIDEAEHPALAARYADYGWPATVILGPDAESVVALRGYRPLPAFAALLQSLVSELDSAGHVAARDPHTTHEAAEGDLGKVRDRSLAQLDSLYDSREGGWGTPQKYPFPAPVEHAFFRAAVAHEPTRLQRALHTLAGHARLIDPVAGGMYQYSVGGRYDRPHYEKLAAIQAGALGNFAEAFRATGDARWRDDALRIAHYVVTELRAPSGLFYASQDADAGHFGEALFVAGADYYALPAENRAKSPAPAFDRHSYANLNGALVRGLVAVYRATDDGAWLHHARAAAAAIEKGHARGALFAHEAQNTGGTLFLSDQVEMAAALVALHEATGERAFRDRAYATMDAALAMFEDPKQHGFFSSSADPNAHGVFAEREKSYEENSLLSRLLLARSHVMDDEHAAQTARAALRALSAPSDVAARGRKVGEYVLALDTEEAPYVMFSIVGKASDPRRGALLHAATRLYAPQAVVALHEPGEGVYPYPGAPALYLCSASACSSPVLAADAVAAQFGAFMAAEQAP